jgi:hypothetical protein
MTSSFGNMPRRTLQNFPDFSVYISVTIFRVIKLLHGYWNGRWVGAEAMIGRKRWVALLRLDTQCETNIRTSKKAAENINLEDDNWHPWRNVLKPSALFGKMQLWKPKDHNRNFVRSVFTVIRLVSGLWKVMAGSHSGDCDGYILLGYDAVKFGKGPIFQRKYRLHFHRWRVSHVRNQ